MPIELPLYCERTLAGLGEEPLNTWSNLFFLLSAFLAWSHTRNSDSPSGAMRAALCLAMVAIAVGSFLFHLTGMGEMLILDVASIAIFVTLASYVLFVQLTSSVLVALVCVLALHALSALLGAIEPLQTLMGGSAAYLGAVVPLCALALYTRFRTSEREQATQLLRASGLMLFSLTLYSLDMPMCSLWPSGTHFVWHAVNATALYWIVCACARESVVL